VYTYNSIYTIIHCGSDASPWPWSLRPKSLSLALMHQDLGLAIQVLDTSHKWQISLLHWCDGVCQQWQYLLAHGNGITYLPSQQCF